MPRKRKEQASSTRQPGGSDRAKFLSELIEDLLTFRYFGQAPEDPIFTSYQPSGEGNLLVITGDNASGKSFFARLTHAYCAQHLQMECIRCSMEKRTEGGIPSAFMYGSENWESTGVISVKNLEGAVGTARSREKDHVLVFDEPDIGLSESFQAPVGLFIADFVRTLPEHTRAVMVITHSRGILRQLLPLNPYHIRCGDVRTLKSVVEDTPADRTVEELLALPTTGIQRFRQINRLLKT